MNVCRIFCIKKLKHGENLNSLQLFGIIQTIKKSFRYSQQSPNNVQLRQRGLKRHTCATTYQSIE